MKEIYAIKMKGDWYLATTVKASEYSEPREPPHGLGMPADAAVWSEHRTTAFLGPVGDEDDCIRLQEAKALLNGRDQFIVDQGLWQTFVDQLDAGK